jgi:tRNA-splicing ligase RtcB
VEFRRVGEVTWEIPATGGMLVPGRVFASQSLFSKAESDRALQQVANVAHLPGIVGASFAMPDIHWGYGFPIGGVAATEVLAGGVVSPGGVGFDICCGVRLLSTGLDLAGFAAHREAIMGELDNRIPRGLGKGSLAGSRLLASVLTRGARAALDAGFGLPADLERCEERGTSSGADPDEVSRLAIERGEGQLGSLGAGNHFLEIQVVERVEDPQAAAAFGLSPGMVTVMIHCGSRGLGHQVCTDRLAEMGRAMSRHGIRVPDRQLACVPVQSSEGAGYLAAMAAAANFAWANRHILAHAVRDAIAAVLGPGEAAGIGTVFDVAHNLAKVEEHRVGGKVKSLCVHRKGATRAFAPGHRELPEDLRVSGQPVLIPGSMGTASWVLRGVAGNPAFATAAHGAGRLMSRKAAAKASGGRQVMRQLEAEGISVRPGSVSLLAEEAPNAYKDVDDVVRVCDLAGLAAPVARLRPVGVVKG